MRCDWTKKTSKLAGFKRALKQKYGFFEGANYTPWIRVQDVKSHGHSGKIDGIKSGRTHHTLSEKETCFFYLAEFSDSIPVHQIDFVALSDSLLYSEQ